MPHETVEPQPPRKVALITGAAHRIGAELSRYVHARGMNLVLHYRRSKAAAHALQEELNAARPDSVVLLQADLLHMAKVKRMVQQAHEAWGRLDAVVNNASTFYPTPLDAIVEAQWDDLIGTNLKAPLFISQAAAGYLRNHRGCIVNITDIHAERPLKGYPLYSVAKAGLVMLTRALARELGPQVRANGVAPGAILWPEQGPDEVTQQRIISRTALKRQGHPDDVARAVWFLIEDAPYITGEIIRVDGGRMLTS